LLRYLNNCVVGNPPMEKNDVHIAISTRQLVLWHRERYADHEPGVLRYMQRNVTLGRDVKRSRRLYLLISSPSLNPSIVLVLFFIPCTQKDFMGYLCPLLREYEKIQGNSVLFRVCDESCD
jgi:hypothetical protein